MRRRLVSESEMISVKVWRIGRITITRPTKLEIAALALFLAFVVLLAMLWK